MFPSADANAARWQIMSAPRGIFVTGTDTGVGKTLVSAALLSALSRQGLRAAAFKPVETGCREIEGTLVGEDCALLAAAGSSGQRAADVAAYLFREPAAPLVAAEAEGVRIDRDALLRSFERIASGSDFVLVESAGGLLVPVADGYTTRDLARDMGLPVVCVVASRLGCINHALLTVEVAAASGLTVAGTVLNVVAERDDYALAGATNRALLARFAPAPDLGVFPFVAPDRRSDLSHLGELAERELALDALLAGRRMG